jgi:hypothetical protein
LCFEAAGGQVALVVELARIGHPLVDQDHARAVVVEQLAQHVAGAGRFLVVGGQPRERLSAAKLPGQFAPQRTHERAVGLGRRVARRNLVAHQHHAPDGRNPAGARGGHHFVDAGQLGRRDAREQVVERQHRVRLAAAEVGLQLHHRVAAAGGEALHRADQHPLQAFGQVGAAEELYRVPVFVCPLAQMHLPQIGGELGLLVATAGHVGMRHHHFAPGLEVAGHAALDCRAGRLPLFAARLLVEAHAQQFHLHLVHIVRLRGRNGGQQTPGGIQCAVGVVAGEGFLVRPGVAHAQQFIDQTALALAENLAEDFGPFAVHDHQRGGDVLQRFALAGGKAGVGEDVLHLERPAVAILRFQFPLDERQQTGFQKFQRFSDPLVVGEGHAQSAFFKFSTAQSIVRATQPSNPSGSICCGSAPSTSSYRSSTTKGTNNPNASASGGNPIWARRNISTSITRL